MHMDTRSSATLGDVLDTTTSTKAVTSDNHQSEPLETVDVTLKAYSWPADARGLLHYRSPVTSYKEFRVRATQESYVVSQDGLDVDMHRETEGSTGRARHGCSDLVVIKPDKHGHMVLKRTCSNYTSNPDMWLTIAKGNSSLSVGSTVRFGSVKVKVIDIVCTSDDIKSRDKIIARLSHPRAELGLPPPTLAPTEQITNPTCRICLDGFEEGNPLIEPCQCRGSVQYIHVDCLVHWINGQLKIRNLPGGGGSYLVRSITCELCKVPYSREVYSHCLIERPPGPHIVLLEQDNKIHVITLNGGTSYINVGRSKESELWLTDISVSRKHAMIKVGPNGEVTVEDSQSKFGTLLEIPKSIPLKVGAAAVSIQIGNVMLSIQLSHPRRIFEYLFVPKRFQAQVGVVRLVDSVDPDVLVIDMDSERRSRVFPRTSNPLLLHD